MGRVTVRAATAADAAALQRVGHATWPLTYSFAGGDYIAHGLASWWTEEAVLRSVGSTSTFVAQVDGAVVGMGNIDLRPDPPVIWKLYVLPEHQGTGAGHALIERLLAEAPTGADVVLEYLAGNDRAEAFYGRHGFTELRRQPSDTDSWPDQVWLVRRSTDDD